MQLKSCQRFGLLITVLEQGFDQQAVLAIAQGLGVEIEIEVLRADMRHRLLIEEKPGHRSSDDRIFAAVAAEYLTDLDDDRLYRRG